MTLLPPTLVTIQSGIDRATIAKASAVKNNKHDITVNLSILIVFYGIRTIGTLSGRASLSTLLCFFPSHT